MKLITDTSTLFTEKDSTDDFFVLPLQVTINNKTYDDLTGITSKEFVDIIKLGHLPTSSQPPVGKVLELDESLDEESLGIFMADGLSGTYATAKANFSDKVTVMNSKTLCGPHRYLVKVARQMQLEGKSIQEIKAHMESLIATTRSYLIPQDFGYLKRGGRLTPLAATLGGLLKIVPVMELTEDGKQLEKFAVARTFNIAINKIIDKMKECGVDDSYLVSVAHGCTEEQAELVKEKVHKFNPNIEVEILELSPVFITQGGPLCVAVQWIKK